MKIAQNSVVSMHYTLKNAEGEIIDQSEQQEPLVYIHGHGQIIPGLENAMDGRILGDKFQISIPPESGYGEFNQAMIQKVPLSMFDTVEPIEPGMQFHAETSNGMQVVTVVAVDDNEVTLDGNHPLAGQNLHFEVEILQIRPATTEELDHGHVHGAGGHHH